MNPLKPTVPAPGLVPTIHDDSPLADPEHGADVHSSKCMDRVHQAIQGTNDLEQMLRDVLDTVVAMFGCDSAVVGTTAGEPAATSDVLAARPERPGATYALASPTDRPMDEELGVIIGRLRSVRGPVQLTTGSTPPLSRRIVERSGVQSVLAMLLEVKLEDPGRLHHLSLEQRSRPRIWTPQEVRLFEAIGRRLGDALATASILRRLERSETRLEQAQRLAHVAYWERDYGTGSSVLSDESRRIFGLELERTPVAGLSQWHERWLELIHPEDRSRIAEAVEAALRGGPRYDVEYRMARPSDGAERIIRSRGDVVRDESGRPRRMVGVMQDVTELRLAEQEVRASEARFRTFVDHATDAFFVHDEQAIVTDANGRACDSLGYSREELIGKHPRAFDVGLDGASLERLSARIAAGETVTFESVHRRKDGTNFPVEVRIGPFQQGARWLRLAVARDITDRKRAEDARRVHLSFLESMDRVNRAIQGARDVERMTSALLDEVLAIFDCDRASIVTVRGEASYSHLAMRAKPGFDGGWLVGVDYPFREEFRVLVRAVESAGGPVQITPGSDPPLPAFMALEPFGVRSLLEMPVYPEIDGPDRSYYFALEQCSYPRVWTPDEVRLFHEIGRRLGDALTTLLTLRNLRRSESRFRTLVNSAADAFFLHDEQGFVTDVNRRACESLGYSREELIGKHPRDFDASLDDASLGRVLERVEAGEILTFESAHRRKDGTTFPVEVRVGQFQQGAHLALVRDITDRKRVEEERRVRIWFLESMDRVNHALQGAQDLEQMTNAVLDEVLAIFDCDRTSVVTFGGAASYRLFAIRARSGFDNGLVAGREYALPEDFGVVARTLEAAGAPVQFTPGSDPPLPAFLSREPFGVRSLLDMPVYPEIEEPDRSYYFNIVQCSSPRVWTPDEVRLFHEIGRRLGDGLTTLLTVRNLRQSESRFRTVVDSAADAIFLHDEQGFVTDVNRRASESLGYSREELIGKHPRDLDAHMDEAAIGRLVARVGAGETVTFETALRRKDGTALPVEARVCLFPQGGHLALVRDITDRKRVEEERRVRIWFLESMDRVNHVLQGKQDVEQMTSAFLDEVLAIFDCDRASIPIAPLGAATFAVLARRTRPGFAGSFVVGGEYPLQEEFREVLRAVESAAGPVQFTAETTPPLPAVALHELQMQSLLEMSVYPEVDEPGRFYQFAITQCSYPRVWTPDEVRLFHEIGRRLGDALTTLLTLRNLRHSESRFRTLVESAADAFMLHARDGTILDVSRQACESLGYGREELIGMNPSRFDAGLDAAAIDEIRDRLAAGETVTFESRQRRKDGTVFPVEVRARAFLGEGGQRIAISLSRDISDRKRADGERERLRQAQAELARISRVTMMGELTASLAHEIQQPIAAAITNANACVRWLAHSPPDLAEARASSERLVKNATRASEIINRVRSLYKKDAARHKRIELNEIIRETVELLGTEASRCSVSLRPRLAPGALVAEGDRVQLQQVFMNLILNGIEAMKETPGALTIESRRNPGDEHLITVTDEGPGIPEGKADEIFEAFFTTKPQGTGMGLTISRSIVEAHGGRLWATPGRERGASFHVALPAASDQR